MDRDIATVRGNEDRMIVEGAPDSPTLRYVREQLTAEHVRWLAGLGITGTVFEDILFCHGTLERDDEYLLHEVSEAGVVPRSTDDLVARLDLLAQPVLLCGHDQTAATVWLPGGRLIVNPGSVGLPAFEDDVPCPHVMQAGRPHARYSVVWRGGAG